MNAKSISTALLIVTAVTFLVALGFRISIGADADAVAVIRTTGMTCGSCARRVSQALEALKGVAATEVDVPGGRVIVGYDSKAIKPETLAEKVTSTGYYSQVTDVVTPEEFKKITGRNVGQNAAPSRGCCGAKGGGCGAHSQS